MGLESLQIQIVRQEKAIIEYFSGFLHAMAQFWPKNVRPDFYSCFQAHLLENPRKHGGEHCSGNCIKSESRQKRQQAEMTKNYILFALESSKNAL